MALSWIIGTVSFFVALKVAYSNSAAWILILFIGFSIATHLRKDFDYENELLFHFISDEYKVFILICTVITGIIIGLIIYSDPGFFTDSIPQFLGILFLVFLPVLPIMLKRELNLYKQLER